MKVNEKLLGTKWIWEKTVMNDDTVVTPKKQGDFSLTFTNDGKVYGTTDCNGFGGSYDLDSENGVTFGPFMSTLMYCDGSQEAIFMKYVSESNQVFFTDEGNLVLLLPYDSGSVIFRK
jgi:heat shock protein HslJ